MWYDATIDEGRSTLLLWLLRISSWRSAAISSYVCAPGLVNCCNCQHCCHHPTKTQKWWHHPRGHHRYSPQPLGLAGVHLPYQQFPPRVPQPPLSSSKPIGSSIVDVPQDPNALGCRPLPSRPRSWAVPCRHGTGTMAWS